VGVALAAHANGRLTCHTHDMTISDGPAWLGDDPIEIALAATHDEYDRAGFVDATTDVLNRLRSQTTSAVTGLVGPWGSGKTSLLRMIEDELVNHAEPGFEWIVSTFNPWTYGDVVSLQTGFFSELRKAFPKGRQWRDVDSLIGSIATRVAPIGALGSFVGVDATGVIESLGKQFSDRSTAKVESRATSALAGMGKPILMIIDDIDRLTATELLEVFKLVRLVGRLPNVYYLLSYDEQTVTDLLLKTDLVGSSSSRRAAEYLEKMIQVRFDIPSLREYQIDNVANAAFAALANSAGGMTRDTQARLRTTFNHAIRPRLRTIRSLRRYFGQIDAFLPAVQGHLDFADFCAVTWIRVSEPGVYAWMQNRKLDLLGLKAYSERHLKT
jgi:predicted KAP-like P-loop ATPase